MDKEAKAIERFKLASDMSQRLYGEPVVVTYSGGKDSDVLLHIAEISGEPFEVLHSLTTADAPETVRHVKETFKRLEDKSVKCEIDKHIKPDGSRVTMWNLIPKKLMPPTRIVRYCCSELKETRGAGRFIATGVRWDESTQRKSRDELEIVTRRKKDKVRFQTDNEEGRRDFETCKIKGKRTVNPIIDWKDKDVYSYIASEKICINPLYCEGFHRVGCIGCPVARTKGREFEFAKYPKIKEAYIRSFDLMLKERKKRCAPAKMDWKNGLDVYNWWMEYDILPGQEYLEGFEP